MVVNFKDIPYYYLNYEGYIDRRIKMENLIKILSINATRVSNNVNLPLRQNRISTGIIKMLKLIREYNIFPSIMMDDDMGLIVPLPETINIPENADFIFLGGSLYECGGIKPTMYITEYDDDFYRVFYMLSLHTIIIPNLKSVNLLLDFLNLALQHNEFCDIVITMKSNDLLFLTPKNGPYFYQDNYNEEVTRFLWKERLDKYLLK
jgi:hypothetical protein